MSSTNWGPSVAESLSRVKYNTTKQPPPRLKKAARKLLPGFRGFCFSCHAEMWEKTMTTPVGSVCRQCHEQRRLVDRYIAVPPLRRGGNPPKFARCGCCGTPGVAMTRGFCKRCYAVRSKPNPAYFHKVPECSTCKWIRTLDKEKWPVDRWERHYEKGKQ